MTNQEAMEWLKFMWEQEHSKGDLSPTPCNTEIALQVAMDALKQPEIVRCKDCEFGQKCVPPHTDYWCDLWGRYHDKNWYCAEGRKR